MAKGNGQFTSGVAARSVTAATNAATDSEAGASNSSAEAQRSGTEPQPTGKWNRARARLSHLPAWAHSAGEQLPVGWALEEERKMVEQINASATATLRAYAEVRAQEHGRVSSAAAAASGAEPLTAACVLALCVVYWAMRRRRVRHRMAPSFSQLELGEKRRQSRVEQGGQQERGDFAVSPASGSLRWSRRTTRRLRMMLSAALSSTPRLALRVRGWLAPEAKRRVSDFTGPSSSSIGIAAAANSAALVCAKEPDFCPALSGSSSDPPSVLSRAQLKILALALPARLAIRDWSLVYSTDQHGCSLWTFMSRAERCGPSLLIVLDSGGSIFGAFNSQSWHREEGYFGTGECFLVKIHPEFDVFRWSRRNDHFALAGADHIAMGGGGGFGLWLDASFENGSSMRSETFDNSPLASAPEFRCVRVELWTFS
ncbi:TLD-domain-containing protein [Pavlovales sp. CCMP2436]|nr:TLD-domain-containing protein [Pavlovales sp. CCMP2436]